jgi:hypothetical protein
MFNRPFENESCGAKPNSFSGAGVRTPGPSAVFIDEFDAGGSHNGLSVGELIHGFSACIPIWVETCPPMGLALFSMRYRINYWVSTR